MDTGRIESREWRTLATTLTHHGSYFDVRVDDVVRPDGSHGTYEHVVARGGVTVLALDDQDRVVLTRQWIYPHGNRQWRLPSGGIDRADPGPETAARRELAEETGLRAATWCPLGRVSGADSITNHVDHVFQATGLTRGADSREGGETDLEVSRLPFAETLELVLSGRMPHAGSAYAVLVAAARRARR